MSKRATIQPLWLDAMFVGWGLSALRSNRGWYSVNPMLKDGIPMPARSMEPQGLCFADWSDLQKAIDALPLNHQCALIRCYRPWTAKTMEQEWPGTSPTSWHRWLNAAAASVFCALERKSA